MTVWPKPCAAPDLATGCGAANFTPATLDAISKGPPPAHVVSAAWGLMTSRKPTAGPEK